MSIKAAGEDDFTKLCFEREIRLIVSIRHLELYGVCADTAALCEGWNVIMRKLNVTRTFV